MSSPQKGAEKGLGGVPRCPRLRPCPCLAGIVWVGKHLPAPEPMAIKGPKTEGLGGIIGDVGMRGWRAALQRNGSGRRHTVSLCLPPLLEGHVLGSASPPTWGWGG